MTRPLIALVFVVLGLAGQSAAMDRAPTILVSIDGFRADYLDLGVTPVMTAMAREGARGALRPSFPSKTYPNHYALVTGLRPDRNGIVDNTFEDPLRPGRAFRLSDRQAVADAFWWNEATPIWVTAERAGLRTAPVFWPGAEAPIQGVRPSVVSPYDMAVPNAARVDRLLALLDKPPAERAAFLTLYIDTVDSAGHDFGPGSPQVRAAVAEVDEQVGRLLDGLQARGIAANLLVVADHGMAEISETRRLDIDDLLPRDAYRAIATGAFLTLDPAPGREDAWRRRCCSPGRILSAGERATYRNASTTAATDASPPSSASRT